MHHRQARNVHHRLRGVDSLTKTLRHRSERIRLLRCGKAWLGEFRRNIQAACPFVSLRTLSHVLRRGAKLRKLTHCWRKLSVAVFVMLYWEIRRRGREALEVWTLATSCEQGVEMFNQALQQLVEASVALDGQVVGEEQRL